MLKDSGTIVKANKLSKRLSTIYDLIDQGSSVADIGSDHGLLVIELFKNKKCQKLFCNDNKIGPFNILHDHISKLNTTDIEVSLSNGINKIPNYIDTVVIAGMGGELIVEILKKDAYLLKNVKTLILQPNTLSSFVRKEVTEMGYKIIDEKIIWEKHFYEVIKFGQGYESYNDDDYLFGPILRKEKSEIFIKMLANKRVKLEKILQNDLDERKKCLICEEIERIKKYEN